MSEYTADLTEMLLTAAESEPHIVIAADRSVLVPDDLKEIAAQFDHNIETVTFDCPRYWDGHDFSRMHVFVNYRCADGKIDSYPCNPPTVDATDETIIHFDWTLSRNVTCAKGVISFLVCVKASDENGFLQNQWSSRLNQEMEVLEGIECNTEEIIPDEPDVIERILNRLDELERNGGGGGDGVVIINASGAGRDTLRILTVNPETGMTYTAAEIDVLAQTKEVVLKAKNARTEGTREGVFRYYRSVKSGGELAHVEFTGHYKDLNLGKWVPATAKIGTDNLVTITDEEWLWKAGEENVEKLLYVDSSGNVAYLQLGTGLEIVNGRLCIIGTVTPDEPDVPDEPDTPVEPDEPDEPAEAVTFAQTGENTVAVSGVVFEQQADGTVLWRGATFTPGEGNTVVIK